MTTISAPTTTRQWQRNPPINSAANDHTTVDGVRISTPVYVDLSVNQRKELLNGVRLAVQAQPIITTPDSVSGIQVESVSSAQSDVESYLGVSLDVLRGVIFQRGGIECGLLIRLQEVTGITYVTQKDFAAAFKKRATLIKDYTTNHPFEGVAQA